MQLLIADRCDYCQRDFSRDPAVFVICPNCGVQNVRAAIEKEGNQMPQKETAALIPAQQRAVAPKPTRKKLKANS